MLTVKWKAALLGVIACCVLQGETFGQTAPLHASVFDGIIVAGYANNGAYINCTGPAIKYSRQSFTVMAGLLPTLLFKQEEKRDDVPRNAAVMPTLGFGLTAIYRRFAIQLPTFYTPKTNVDDGKWKPGIGVGYRF